MATLVPALREGAHAAVALACAWWLASRVPLRTPPDPSLPPEELIVGGVGLLLIRQLGSAVAYSYSQGHNRPLYNPLLFRLWKYEDLVSGLSQIAQHRAYVLIISLVLFSLSHLFYQRRSRTAAPKARNMIARGKR